MILKRLKNTFPVTGDIAADKRKKCLFVGSFHLVVGNRGYTSKQRDIYPDAVWSGADEET